MKIRITPKLFRDIKRFITLGKLVKEVVDDKPKGGCAK